MYPVRDAADLLYFERLDRTDWRGFRPPATNPRSLLYRLCDSPLRRIAYPLAMRLLAWHRSLTSGLRAAGGPAT